MQTTLAAEFQNPAGRRAADILRQCVHCGFCNATCPTYELLGDELDGPRGRLYQMKQLFEGEGNAAMRLHLDRCLLCRNCETTCPSGVEYSALLDLSQSVLDEKFPRALAERARRGLIGRLTAQRWLFSGLLRLGRRLHGVLPGWLASQVPPTPSSSSSPRLVWPKARHPRRMIALAGCVQSAMTPNTNLAAAHVLDRLGITLFEVAGAGCCGSVQSHTRGEARGQADARALIDRWLPYLERGDAARVDSARAASSGIEAIVMTASGCGLAVREYPRLLANDPDYRDKARRISEKTLDLCELIEGELPAGYAPAHPWPAAGGQPKVAFHAPCTLQHGQRIRGVVESILRRAGYAMCAVRDAHLCCGSAGAYSILQPLIATPLRQAKQAALAAESPDVVCTANVGCQTHLMVDSRLPVVHWIELLL